MFETIKIKDTEYQLRLDLENVMALETALNSNPVNILIDMEKGVVPKISDMVLILHFSLQSMNHDIDMQKTQDLFKAYIDDGNTVFDFCTVITKVLKSSGLIAKN